MSCTKQAWQVIYIMLFPLPLWDVQTLVFHSLLHYVFSSSHPDGTEHPPGLSMGDTERNPVSTAHRHSSDIQGGLSDCHSVHYLAVPVGDSLAALTR